MGEFAQKLDEKYPHIAVCPSVGIGHTVPFLRLASMLSSSNCKVTLITIQPTVSIAESKQISTFLSTHPHINSLEIPFQPETPHSNGNNGHNAAITTSKAGPDPFFLRYAFISKSAHLFTHHITTLTPRPSAVISDIMFVTGFSQGGLGDIPNLVLSVISAKCFAVTTYLADVTISNDESLKNKLDLTNKNNLDVELVEFPPGLPPIPLSSIPPPFFNPNHIFTKMLFSNSSDLKKAQGIILNTFDYFEAETLLALQARKVLSDLPQIYPIGPFKLLPNPNPSKYPEWLDEQPSKSVLLVSFGSRTALGREQLHELRDGLEKSGVRFFWIIKTTTVDKDENDEKLEDLLEEGFLERTKGKGMVFKGWVDQEVIMGHPAIGGFVTHCGWNSIAEVAQRGIPILAWPLHGDQKWGALVAEEAGLGVWEKGWGWLGERLVKSDEIVEKIKVVMENEELRNSAMKVGEEASKAWNEGGSSKCMLAKMIDDIKSLSKNTTEI